MPRFTVWIESPGMTTREVVVEAGGLRAAHAAGSAELAEGEFVRGVQPREEEGAEPSSPELVELRVPGAIYFECLDPDATSVPRESGWPDAELVRVGRGRQAVYRVAPAVAAEIVDHVREMGETWSYGVDDVSIGRRMVRWAEARA